MPRLSVIVGVRPHFVKASVLLPALRAVGEIQLVHTGQHYDAPMSEVFFQDLRLPRPDVHLDVHDGSQADQIGQAIPRASEVLKTFEPHLVVVIGDANAGAAGALAAAMTGYRVCHVEAGTRSFSQMPEELNRVLIDSVSTVFCCSTENSMANLKAEGVVDRVHLTGDLLAETTARHTPDSVATRTLLDRYSIKAHEYAFVTFHRAENTDDPARLASFAEALRDLPLPALFPAHPRTRKALERNGYWEPLVGCPHLRILQPLSYMETLGLLANAKFVLSDSSGIQREAYLLGSPCLVLRDVSEYPDLIAEGSGALVGVDYVKIREAISELSMQVAEVPERNLLGGEASKKIVDAVVEYLRAQEV